MSSKFRFASVLLVAILIVVVGCSISAVRTNATVFNVKLRARHQDSICFDVGTIVVDSKPNTLPAILAVADGQDHPIDFLAPAGCEFVMWETEGLVFIRGKGTNSFAVGAGGGSAAIMYVQGEGTLRVVYRGTCCGSVGAIMAPVNPLITLAPYLAVIGLVATAATIAVKKRRN